MKIKLLLLLLLAVPAFSQTAANQDEKPKRSKLEEFSSRSGQLIQRKFVDIGTFKGVKVRILTLTDVLSGKAVSGVRFEKASYIGSSSRTAICFLDQDEVDAAIKALRYIKNDVLSSTPETYTEYQFSSRSDFEVGCFSRDKNWTGYIRVSRYTDDFVSFNIAEFDGLLKLIDEAKTKLPTAK